MKSRISDTFLRQELGPSHRTEVYDTVESGFVATLFPSGKVSFYLYEQRGRKKTKLCDFPAWTTKEARELCKQRKRTNSTDSLPNISLKKFIDEIYKPDYALDHKNLKHLANLKPFENEWGNENLQDITETMLEEWRVRRRRGRVKASTVNRNVSALKALLSFAVRKKYLHEHPIRDLKRLTVEQEHRVRWLSDDEEANLREALIEREDRMREERRTSNVWRADRDYELKPDLSNYKFADHLRPMVLISLNTGLRQGELFSLTWNRVVDGFITVSATSSKSRRSRHVPLNKEARNTISHWRELNESKSFVFPGPTGERLDNVKTGWTAILKKAKISDFRWHDMRHHFASKLVMAGVPLNTVRELLGHADLQTTMRYAHLAPKHLREAVELLS